MNEYYAGIDIGSTMTKIVIMSDVILASVVSYSGPEHRKLANIVMSQALEKAGLTFQDLTYIVATGYGRVNVPFADKQITEISCHAKCISTMFPTVRTVIDIGGQDSKAIKIKDGRITEFVMNDKCAAGTGRFIEVIAEALGVKLEDIGPLSLTSTNDITISNTCVVFAEQEVVGRLAEGIAIADLAAAIHKSLVTRIISMAGRLKIEKDVAVTGGGAKNTGLIAAIEAKLGYKVLVPEEPLLTGAIGAALFARETVEKAKKEGLTLERSKEPLKEATFFS